MKKKLPLVVICLLLVQNIFSSVSYIDSLRVFTKKKDKISFSSHNSNTSEFNYDYIKKEFPISSALNDSLQKAQAVIKKIEETQNYINELSASSMLKLPVGIKKEIGNNTAILGVSAARFTSEYTEIDVFFKMTIPQLDENGKQKALFFGASGIKISHKGGIYGDSNLSLLGDVAIPINGGNAMVVLKGGFDMLTGNINKQTYVTIDCNGFKELGVAADVMFSRGLLEPVDPNYNVIPDKKQKVTGHFEAVVSDWNDILTEISLPPFQLAKDNSEDGTGKAGLVFELNKAVFDFSDIRNADITFPKEYTQYLIPGNEQMWRGVYVNSLKVVLPKQFKKRNSDKQLSFAAADVFIDGMGITGNFSVDNILPLKDGDASGWQFSVDHLEASFVTNNLTGAGFDGSIVLPLSEEITEKDAKSKVEEGKKKSNKGIAYSAIIDPSNDEYILTLEALKDISFDVFKAEATLTKNSYVEMKVSKSKFRPKAVLHGSLNINASNSQTEDGKKGLVDFKGITFQKLQLQTESPYFQVDYMGYSEPVKFANFPVTISEIGVTATQDRAALHFAIDVNLMGKGFAGGTKLAVKGKFDKSSGSHRWKYDGIDIDRINVAADLGKVKFEGFVDIKDNDPVYGNGFYGELSADFNAIKVTASAWFGKTEFRYWYVDAYADLSNTPVKMYIGPAIVNGFGGGAYYRMAKNNNPPKLVYDGKPVTTPGPPSGMDYAPDANSGLGFRAMVGFALANEKAFNGKVGFEMAFNRHGGLNRILFFGEGHIMKTLDFKFGDKFKEKMNKLQNKINDFGENNAAMQSLKESNLVEYSKVSFPQEGLTFDVGIDAHFSMEMDFRNDSFHAEMEVYLNTPLNVISGVGPRGRAGWAVFHAGPDAWYLHMGTPKDRIGIRVGIGPISVKATSYFMIGDKIPGSPPPPAAVAEILGVQLNKLDYMRDLNALGDGRGFAIGMDLSVDTGDLTFLVFYARLRAGVGFDIMIKDYGETACRGSGQIGIDGWYANGQAYAYVAGELGIKVNLWFIKKKIPILKAGAAVLLQAKLPNPAWFRGYVGGYFSVLGGLISGRFRFKVEIGDECEIIGGAPLGGLKIISGVTPNNEATDVDVFTSPQAAFNVKINKPFEIEDDQGVKTYRVLLDEYSVTEDGKPIKGVLEWNSSNDVANFESFNTLPSKATIKVKVAVSFQESRGGNWVTILQNGRKAQEIEERTFTTGEAPDHIPVKNIVYTYPVIEQSNFYKKERSTGYIKLKKGQPELFAPVTNWTQKIKYSNESGFNEIQNVSYDESNKQVNFKFGNFSNENTYVLKIVSFPPVSGSSKNTVTYTEQKTGQEGNIVKTRNKNVQQNVKNNTVETEIITYKFATSKYNTFAQKIKDKDATKHYLDPIYSDVHAIQTDVQPSERLNIMELEGDRYTDNKPLVAVEALLDDSYYKRNIYPLIYKGYPLEPSFTVDRDISKLGLPPKKGVDVLTWYKPYLIEKPYYSLLDIRIPYRYHLPYYYKSDFIDIQYKVVNKYLKNPKAYKSEIQKYDYIINGVFPSIKRGNYKVKMQYVLPGGILGTKATFKYNNPF